MAAASANRGDLHRLQQRHEAVGLNVAHTRRPLLALALGLGCAESGGEAVEVLQQILRRCAASTGGLPGPG